MLGKESPLRRLPAALDRKQALYFDGMRHAIEIADLAYLRLAATLNWLAREEALQHDDAMTSAFADSWTFVDAEHRFYSLYRRVPGFEDLCGPPTRDAAAVKALFAVVTLMRNVADHIETRVDYVLAKRMPALGALTWFTVDADMNGGRSCALSPGSITGKNTLKAVNPVGRDATFVHHTGLIHLAAGEYRVCLSDVHDKLESVVRHLELVIGEQATGMDHSASDLLVVMTVRFDQPATSAT